jgi:hypothetical protein
VVRFVRRHRWLSAFGAVALVFAAVVIGMGFYLAGVAGELPWQTHPTRIPITPFAGIEGFTAPTRVSTANPATPTPVP